MYERQPPKKQKENVVTCRTRAMVVVTLNIDGRSKQGEWVENELDVHSQAGGGGSGMR